MVRLISMFFLLTVYCSASLAEALPPNQVPEPLKPWIDWVLYDQQDRQCPFIYNDYRNKDCAWPSQLTLNLTPRQGLFQIDWKVYRQSWITLPGNKSHWPHKVKVNGAPAVVVEKNQRPVIQLNPGDYKINGEFNWSRIPKILTIPEDTALLDLKINNKVVLQPQIKKDQLWLKSTDKATELSGVKHNTLDIQVFRKIIDDVPLQVRTHIDLEVSGQQREIQLPHLLLKGMIPIELNAPLPARLEPDGQLRMQVRPGHWQLELLARFDQPQADVALAINSKHWPKTEVWVFEARPALRVVDITGLTTIDSSQTKLPNKWRQLPAYRVKQGAAMKFKLLQRGDPEPEPNQLRLQRKIWLDFEGTGYTVNDHINGTITRDWRLNALPDTRLGKVSLDGYDQLITSHAGQQGVEVRKGRLNLSADSRLETAIDSINVTGWQQNFQQVNAELNIPPGWRLLAVSGVDNQPNSWLTKWTLLDLFLVLIASLAVGRLWHRYWGLFALLTLALIWHEAGAPRFIWLNILAAIALIRVLPHGKFLTVITWFRHGFFLILLLIMIPFMVDQVRIGLYPQLERSWQRIMPSSPAPAQEMLAEDKVMSMEGAPGKRRVRSVLQKSAQVMTGKYAAEPDFERIDTKAKVQTGPGLPQWQWHKVNLSWNGSVDAGQQLQLWYLTPVMTMLLNFIRVALILVLAALMFGVIKKTFKFRFPTFSWLLFIPFCFMPVNDAFARFPDQAMLDELKNRMTQAPECLPSCSEISQMELSVNDKEVTVKLEVHNQKSAALPLPVHYQQWFPVQVKVNDKPAKALLRQDNNLWLGLSEGVHQVVLTGPTPLLDKFSLPLVLKPKQIKVKAQDWLIEGIYDDGRVDNQLQLSRVQNRVQQPEQKKLQPGVLPAFVRVERILQLGLDWQVITRVSRLSPTGSTVALNIPLLPNESVTTADVHVSQGKVAVTLSAQQKSMQWRSTLAKTARIHLQAANSDQWIEVWRLDVSPVWHIETTGLAMMHLNHQGHWLPEWHPWGKEELTVTINRPEPVLGSTMTIESSHVTVQPGQRNQKASLALKIKSSLGGQHSIKLPEQAQLQSVLINGVSQPIRQKNRELTLPIVPGQQSFLINWQSANEITPVVQTSDIDLGQDSVNTNLQIDLGENRWLLITMGPDFGPAVLFWGVLLVIVLISIALGRLPLTPLKHWQWFLLLLGLSQIPLEAAVLVVAWLIILGYRAEHQPASPVYFNLLQVLIAGLTFIALVLLFQAVEQGLLGTPQMQIVGNHSSAYHLHWYQDRSQQVLPVATVISLPKFAYRLLMLGWSLWLAAALLDWLKWGWQCFVSQGIWQSKSKPELKSDL